MPLGHIPVLLIEDTPSLARVYTEFLKKESYRVIAVETGAAAIEQLADGAPKVVLLDLQLPDMNGMEVLKRINAQALPCAVIVITAHGSVNAAVEAMRYGAYDFLVKPFSADRLVVTVRNAVERLRLAQMVDSLEQNLGRARYHGFIGSSLAMQAVYRIVDSAASSRATVFITGESGTGKEVCAEAIHRQSQRAAKPFIAINCGAIPKDLMESEIFGHMKGSFTGAVADREGAAARADGGTLFLDEICELAPDLQTKLLRFIQTGTFTPVGGSKLEKVDLRIVCATNRDPLHEVEEGRFREDLYYRLHVIPIHLPPLREREDDVLEIARHYLAEFTAEEKKGFTQFAPETEQALRHYHWPGNVRQLQNVVRIVSVLHDGDTVLPQMLPAPLGAPGGGVAGLIAAAPVPMATVLEAVAPPPAPLPPPLTPEAIKPLWEVEKDAIENAITACEGNIPRAAALLEISASTIYRKRLAWQAEGKL
ncbi:sigma-54-dependent transcriptional regulator [Azospirillum griseum]|uniref:Sigma-54-dependent Fis family transcriptional regulator n=1 Tax=Azospirillum griseum TaxID=2496639 RepID=A0A3S0JJR5_9PROT|nr:sigma-54 dependent transcriptional regulator [Azospirillum griseum]RTR21893.1 sigma-54-dependent Fis family transcriptional regulator [Azospirillum griseum]